MFRKIWLFVAVFLLLLGLETLFLKSVTLTSQGTEILAKQDPSIERKRWWIEALTGDELKFPEKEIPIRNEIGYILLAFSTVGFMHWIFIPREK
ncbi:MAG: hypothetical protein IJD43_08700 [Thermoguttaceae bacterium]|nr:hypothetical protein [Planctomycetaceae bacterium]MBQ4143538.1 hypothetical protein [Thermoguttaceae bacterium]